MQLLTPEQWEAVSHENNVCLVSCPGSGKTRAIVAKLLRCIEEIRDSTRRVACITHTNAGADEIDSRLRRTAFSDEQEFYEVATIHSFALQNIFRLFHTLLPMFAHGFTITTSEDEAFQAERERIRNKYNLHQGWLAEAFDNIQRLPSGVVHVPEGIPNLAGQEWCEWLDQNGLTTLGDLVYHSCRILDNNNYGRCPFRCWN